MAEDRKDIARAHQARLQTVLDHLKEAQQQPRPFDVQVGMKPVKDLADIVSAIHEDLPDTVPEFKPQDYVVFQSLKSQPRCDNQRVQAYVREAMDRLDRVLGD